MSSYEHPPEPPPAELPAGRGVHIWRCAIIMPFITGTFVALRFYSRLYLNKRKLTIDDYVVMATMVSVIVHAVLIAQATKHGMGLHVWQYDDELNSEYYLWIGISSQFYVTSLMGFKSALILLYLQLFGVHRRFRIACYITMFYTLGYLLCNLITEFAGCTPVQKKWHSDLPGHCINTTAANIFYGAGHMTSDLIIAILPLTMIWSLKMRSTRQKIGLSVVLCSGFLFVGFANPPRLPLAFWANMFLGRSAWAIACVRWSISTYNQLIYDRPWWAGISFLFSILEVNTGLICACIATLGPLFNSSWKKFRAFTTRGSSKTATEDLESQGQNNWHAIQGSGGKFGKRFSDITTIGGSGGRSRKMSKDVYNIQAIGPHGSRKQSVDPYDTLLLATIPSRTPSRTELPPIPPGSADGEHMQGGSSGNFSTADTDDERPLHEGTRYQISLRPETVRSATQTTLASVNTLSNYAEAPEQDNSPGGLRPPSKLAHRDG